MDRHLQERRAPSSPSRARATAGAGNASACSGGRVLDHGAAALDGADASPSKAAAKPNGAVVAAQLPPAAASSAWPRRQCATIPQRRQRPRGSPRAADFASLSARRCAASSSVASMPASTSCSAFSAAASVPLVRPQRLAAVGQELVHLVAVHCWMPGSRWAVADVCLRYHQQLQPAFASGL